MIDVLFGGMGMSRDGDAAPGSGVCCVGWAATGECMICEPLRGGRAGGFPTAPESLEFDCRVVGLDDCGLPNGVSSNTV